MYEDILKKESKKEKYVIEPISPVASFDLKESTAKKSPYVIAHGIRRTLAFMGIKMSVSHQMMDSHDGEEEPRWLFQFELDDYKE